MRKIKTVLTVLILAVAVVAAIIALFWEQLLTPEQKLQYGLFQSAARDYEARALAHPDNEAMLADYLNIQVLMGNLGRAAYLSDLYGVKSTGEYAGRLGELRDAVRLSQEAADRGEVYALHSDPTVKAVAELPVGQAFLYLEGYQYALRGDWASAHNNFAAIDDRLIAPVLKPYYQYYLARSCRLAGGEEEREKLVGLFEQVISSAPDSELVGKARYNLIAWYLSDAYTGNGEQAAAGQLVALANQPPGWALQKAFTEFANYYYEQSRMDEAWEMAQDALMVDPFSQAAESPGQLMMTLLNSLLEEEAVWGLDSQGGIVLELQPGVFRALAECSARRSFAAHCAGLLDGLKPHLAANDRSSWEELRVGMAICYRAERNSTAMRELMADANLRDLSDPNLGEIYFQYAQMLESEQQWNRALEYYRSCQRLSSARAGEALYRSYAILKHVQEPLDLARSVELLAQVVEEFPDSPDVPQAIEELIPLLIYRGETGQAQQLVDWILDLEIVKNVADADDRRTGEQLGEVALFWQGYLARQAGRQTVADEALGEIRVRYWNYYELISSDDPQADLAVNPTVLAHAGRAGEYLAGLGLIDSASESLAGEGDPDNQILLYMSLASQDQLDPMHIVQWEATELLESGRITERALLDYAIPLAYPRAFADEVRNAAAEFNVPAPLIWAMMKKESNFRPDDVSSVGAVGLMQVMPATARWLDGKYNMGIGGGDISEPRTNIRLGAAYIANLVEIFGAGQLRAIIHAYNGGDGNFRKWRDRYQTDDTLLTELIPNEENETFGKKVYRYYKVYQWLDGRSGE
ncbi:lytic transglycosylase domain-containing protein [bacterium]|nr:lytic transglycosylase domain-containing protein [bacterium]